MPHENTDISRRRKSTLVGNITLAAASVLITLILMEGTLRFAPSLIGVPLLASFPNPLRHHIAKELELPSINDFEVIDTAARFDHGPPIYKPAPNNLFISLLDQADMALGAVKSERRDSRGFCNPLENEGRTHVD